MVTVVYDHEFAYPHDMDGTRYPRLTLRGSNPADLAQAVDFEVYLDSGAQRSLLNGWIATSIGIDPLQGLPLSYEPTVGIALTATLHTIRLDHSNLGTFELEVGFSSGPIRRNLLGRDFFNLVQIGFREHQLTFYVTTAP